VRVVITQPDFWPWLGFFDKVAKADRFIFLDHVANRPNDGILTKRVRILLGGRSHWLGIPLCRDRQREFVPIAEMVIDNEPRLCRKQLETVRHAYSKHTFFREIFPLVEAYYQLGGTSIADRNIMAVEWVCERLGLRLEYTRSSTMQISGHSNQMLLNIVNHVDGTEYLYGAGSTEYLDFEMWAASGIKLVAQDFSHPVYEQGGSSAFTSGLSVIDALMNLGFSGVRALMVE